MPVFNSTLDTAGYEAARAFIIGLSPAFAILAIILALAQLFAFWRFSPTLGRRVTALVVLFLLAGEALLAWFHYQIYNSFGLVQPYTGEAAARPIIPLWVESEKFYFWTIAFCVLVFLLQRREVGALMAKGLSVGLGIMLVLLATYASPFVDPLPQLHRELAQIAAGLRSSNPQSFANAYEMALGSWRYFYGSSFMWIHPPLLFVSYGAFLAGFIGNLLMLYSKDKAIEETGASAIKFGYLVLTLGMLVGYPWALEAWRGMPWWWSPKINVSIMMWVFYSAYLHSRLYLLKRGMWTATALLGLLSFLALMFTYITTYLMPGVHSYG